MLLVVEYDCGLVAVRSGALIFPRIPMPLLPVMDRPSREGVRYGYWP
jgi:hypothetical protein